MTYAYLFVQSRLMCVILVDTLNECLLKISDDHSKCILKTLTLLQSCPSIAFWMLCQPLQKKQPWVLPTRIKQPAPTSWQAFAIWCPNEFTSHLCLLMFAVYLWNCVCCASKNFILSTLCNVKPLDSAWSVIRFVNFGSDACFSHFGWLRRVFLRARMVSVRAPAENQGTAFHAHLHRGKIVFPWLHAMFLWSQTMPCFDAMVGVQAVDLRISLKIWKRRHKGEHCELNLNPKYSLVLSFFLQADLAFPVSVLARWPKIGPISWRPLQMLMMSLQRQGM